MKKYQAPTIEVCEIAIEEGIAMSEVESKSYFDFEEHEEVDM